MRYWIAGVGMLLALSRLQAAAGPPSYRLDSWTTANGLPSNTISALRQTRDGYLWLATDNGYEGTLSRDTEMNLYRIAQEALNNLMKHAEATTVHVALKQEGPKVRLTIADSGVGFAPGAAAYTRDGDGPGFGLTSIAARVRLLRGTLIIRSSPGQGTTVEVVLDSGVEPGRVVQRPGKPADKAGAT